MLLENKVTHATFLNTIRYKHKHVVLKGNEALEKKIFFFFSNARKYGEEIKIKKKN